VKAGDPVIAQRVIDAGVALQVELGERGFATATVGEQDIVVDHEAQVARLVLPVTPGPVARFGQITVTGQPPFSARHVQRIARFKPGDRFERSEVNDLRRALVATGLVASVEVRPVPHAEAMHADEMWLSSSTKEVLAVTTIDGRPYGSGKPGPVFHRVWEAFQKAKAAAPLPA